MVFGIAEKVLQRAARRAAAHLAIIAGSGQAGQDDQLPGLGGKRAVELRGKVLGKGGLDILQPAADRTVADAFTSVVRDYNGRLRPRQASC